MEKIKKSYIEKIYRGLLFSESSIAEVEDRDPMKVVNDGKMQGFRFYDKEQVVDGEKIYDGERVNFSNWVFFGKRLTLEEVKQQYGKDSKYSTLISNMECNHYNSVCLTQAGSYLPMEEGDMTLDEYISEHDKEKNAIRMFEALKKHIGQSVNYKAWWYGSPENGTDILKNVSYFSNVEIGCMGIPFIGYGSAISEISLTETGEVIYSNPYIESNYDRRKAEDVEELKRKMFGDVIVDKQRSRRIKAEAKREKAMEEANLEAKRLKYTLMKEGLTLVKPETAEEWLQFADNNSNDGYSVFVVKAVISMMKKLDAGISFEDAEQQVYCDELGLSGFMAGATANALSHFAKQGEEYRKHWNKKYGVEDSEEKGTVNPAMLTIKKK